MNVRVGGVVARRSMSIGKGCCSSERLPVDCHVAVFERTIVFDSRWRQWAVSHREDAQARVLLARVLNEAFEQWRARFGRGGEHVPDMLGGLRG